MKTYTIEKISENEPDGHELARLIKLNKSKKFIPWEKVRTSVKL